jgi:hypothetical protein
VDGYLSRARINKSLGIRDWTRANEIIRDWEIAGTSEPVAPSGMPVAQACEAFMADAEAQRLSESSLKKYRVLLINPRRPENPEKYSPSLLTFCVEKGNQFIHQITPTELTRFRAQWKDGATSGGKKLERLRAFGRFVVDQGWWAENCALKLKRPKVTDPPTMPFTREEVAALLAACDKYIDWRGQTGQDNAQRCGLSSCSCGTRLCVSAMPPVALWTA